MTEQWQLQNNRRRDETIYAFHSSTLLYYRESRRHDSPFLVQGSLSGAWLHDVASLERSDSLRPC